MKHSWSLLVIVSLFFLLSSCATWKKEPYLAIEGEIKPEALNSISRPVELSYQFTKQVEHTVTEGRVFGLPTGDATSSKSIVQMIFGNNDNINDPLISAAAYEAVVANEADGIYITNAKVRETFFWWPMFGSRKATIQGYLFKIVNKGEVSEERADRIRAINKGASPYGLPIQMIQKQ